MCDIATLPPWETLETRRNIYMTLLVINQRPGAGARALTPAEIKHPCDAVTAQHDPWDFGAIIGVTST